MPSLYIAVSYLIYVMSLPDSLLKYREFESCQIQIQGGRVWIVRVRPDPEEG